MSAWVLVPCLVSLRAELKRLASGRDTASDGAVGDANHTSSSDHTPDEDSTVLRGKDADSVNEVHAIDTDKSGTWPAGWSMERVVQTIVLRHRNGLDDRLQNVIFNRRIWSRSWGWTARAYNGPNPHTEHAHFSARYTTAQEQDTSPWGLLDEEDDVTKTDFHAWLTEWAKSTVGKAAIANAVFNTDGVIPAPGNPKPGKNPDGTDINTHWGAGSYLQNTYAAAVSGRDYAAQGRTAVTALAAKDVVDEQALAQAVVSALPPDRDDITAAELEQALINAFRRMTGPAAEQPAA